MTGKDATVKPPSAEQRGKAAFLCVSGVFENWKVVIWSWKMSEARLACHVVVLSSSARGEAMTQLSHVFAWGFPRRLDAALDEVGVGRWTQVIYKLHHAVVS